MKLVTMPYDVDQAMEFIKGKVDCLLLANKQISLRYANSFSFKDIIKIVNNKQNSQVFVLVNQFFFEPQLETLIKHLKFLNKLDIDGVYFQDYAVVQIIHEHNLKLKPIYHSETLVTSYGQISFFIKNQINHVVLARELFLSEVKQIANHKPENFQIELQAQGFMFIMHSRWKMISNFENYNHIRNLHQQKQLWIKEALRKWPNAIYQDKFGTHMFSGYEICVMSIIDQLYKMKIDYLRIDNVMQTRQWCEKITKIYQSTIELLRQDKLTSKQLEKNVTIIKEIVKPNAITPAFLGKIEDIYHLEKSEQNEQK